MGNHEAIQVSNSFK